MEPESTSTPITAPVSTDFLLSSRAHPFRLQPGDVERNSAFSSATQPDPFMIRAGLKTDEEIAEIRRRRKTGKRLAKYHQKQNDVCSCILLPSHPKTNYIRSSLPLC